MFSKKQLRKAIQEALNKSKRAYLAGDVEAYIQHANDAHFLAQELEELKGS